jgi:signal transduction histidine kinase
MTLRLERWWPNHLRGRLTALVLVALVPMLIAQATVFAYWYRTQKYTELEASVEMARALGSFCDRYLTDLAHTEATLGEVVLQLDPARASGLLASRASEYPGVNSFSWVDPRGIVLISSRSEGKGVSVADREYFQEILKGKEWSASDLIQLKVVREDRLILARGIRSGDNVLLGVILAEIVPQKLAEILATPRSGGGILALFDRKGLVLSLVRGPEVPISVLRFKEKDPMALHVIRTGKIVTGIDQLPGEDIDRLAARVPIGDLGWVAGASRPLSEVMAPVRQNLLYILLAVSAVTLLSLLVAQLMARSIINSVAVVREGAASLAAGNKTRVRLPEILELRDLALTFNYMAEQLTVHASSLQKTADELRRSNEELEAFSYSVSHDLRAPLRAIDGFANALMEDHAGRLEEEGLRYLSIIRENTERMGQLIDDLLSYSRLGRKEPSFEEIDMQALARVVAQDLEAAGEANQSALRIGDLPPAVGDPTLIRQTLSNLLSNAFKFSSSQEHPKVEVGGRQESEENVYWVRDNGVGFDMAYSHKLFTIFQRLHAMKEFPGTGVGLAIVQRVMQKHGGRAWAEGAVNQGATFYFAVPRRRLDQRSRNTPD